MNFSTMQGILEEIQSVFLHAQLLDMREVQQSAWILTFDRGKLFVCLKGIFAGFHLTKLPWKGKTLSLLQKLRGCSLAHLQLVNEDRILALQFSNGEQLVFEMFPQGKMQCTQDYTPPERTFSHTSPPVLLTSSEIDDQVLKELERCWLQKWTERMQKRCAHFEKEVEEGRTWKIRMHEAELLQAYFFRLQKGMQKIDLEDWEDEGRLHPIILDPDKEPREIVQLGFKKAGKLKRKLEVAEQLLEKVRKEMQHPPPFAFPEEKEGKKTTQAIPYKQFTTKTGLHIFVGKKDRDNDTLTFKFSRGSDLWFHAADTPGSHVVLKVHKKEPPDEEALKDALQLALYFSKARGKTSDVIMTPCKYLSKSKGAKAGLVNVSRHKKVTVRPDPARLNLLLKPDVKSVGKEKS